jgi:transcription initiation factor TFIID subunit 6
MKTLLVAVITSDKSKGTREGAIRGLAGIGKEAVRKGLVEGGGVKVVGSECMPGKTDSLVDSVMVSILHIHVITRIEDLDRLPYMFCILHRTCLIH